MELFLHVLGICACIISIVVNILFVIKIRKFEKDVINMFRVISDDLDTLSNHQIETDRKFDMMSADLDRIFRGIREQLDALKPIKTNNWENIQKAFRGPVRIELNERD